MRFRSFLAVLVLAIAGLGFTGCGSSGSGSEFRGHNQRRVSHRPRGSSSLTLFRLKRPSRSMLPLPICSLTSTTVSTPTPFFSTFRAFDAQISIGGVPTASTLVIITAFDANGIPLQTFTQTISVAGGETTVIEGIASPVAVTLVQLRLAPGNLFELDQQLTEVDVVVGLTTQVFLFGEYSDGSIVLLGDLGTYSTVDEGIATVSTLGTVSGISIGTTTLLAQFGGQDHQCSGERHRRPGSVGRNRYHQRRPGRGFRRRSG